MPKRFLAAVVTLPLLITVTASASPVVSPVSGPCDLARRSSESTQHFMRRRISCAVDRFGPVGGGSARAICIARRESGLNPTAKSASGEYLGLYQHAATMWPDRFKKWTNRSWDLSKRALNGRSNSIVTIRMVHAIGGWKAAGWPIKHC